MKETALKKNLSMFCKIVLFIVICSILLPSALTAQQTSNQQTTFVDIDNLLQQARQLVQQGDFQQARQFYQTLIRHSPNFYLIHIEIAYTFFLESQQLQAQEKESLAQQSQETGTQILTALFRKLDPQLHPFLNKIGPQSEKQLLGQAQEYAQKGQFLEARKIYRLLLFLIPNWIPARIGLINLMVIHLQKQQVQKARQILETFKLRQQTLHLARHSVKQNNFRQAILLYELLSALIPNFHLAELELAYTLILQGNQFQQQEEQDDDRAQQFQNAGLQLLTAILEQLDPELRPFLTTKEFLTEVNLLQQAQKAAKKGELHKARKLYSLLLFLIPNWETARIGLMFMYARLGEKERARVILRGFDFNELDPHILQALINLGLSKSKFQLFFLPQFTFTTNLSQSTTQQTVRIPAFGNLPFTLDTQREESGIGGRMITGFVFEEEIAQRLGLRTKITTQYAQFENQRYDELNVSADVSLIRRVGKFQHSLAAIGNTTRVGQNGREERAIGWSVRTAYAGKPFHSRSSLSASYIKGYRAWKNDTDRRIVQFYHNFGLFLLPYGRLNLSAFFTDADWFIRQTSDNLEVQITTQFLWANLPYIRPTLSLSLAGTWYEKLDNLFIKRRQDKRIRTSISLCITSWTLFGRMFCPRYTYIRNISNIPLQDYYSHNIDVQFEAWTW